VILLRLEIIVNEMNETTENVREYIDWAKKKTEWYDPLTEMNIFSELNNVECKY
jgi:hypothetical protein